MVTRTIALHGIFLIAVLIQPMAAQSGKAPEPADMVSWRTIEGVELSPDGRQVIYSVKEADVSRNRYVKSLWIVPADGSAPPARLTDSEKDSSPKWSPDGKAIAVLSSREGGQQIWTTARPGGAWEKVTSAAGGVMSFQWAPDGRHIAFLSRSPVKGPFEAQRDKDAGVVINRWDFVVYKLLNSAEFLQLDQVNELWIVEVAAKRAEPAILDRHVTQFAWAPDGSRIAAIFQALPGLATQRSDVLIYSVADRQSKVILEGTGGREFDDTTAYSNPMWSPDGGSLALFRKRSAERWQARPELGLYRFSDSEFTEVPRADRLVLYQERLLWTSPDRMFLENTVRGTRRLFELSLATGDVEPAGGDAGPASRFSFSRDGKTAAFVRESAMTPPELYIARAPFTSPVRATSLNARYADLALPAAERVNWKSRDGVEVEGWLLKPPGFRADRRYPLVVIVHGGPGAVVPDEFEMLREWPYPYRLLANRGYVVLFPNYRGTGSYSHAFSRPSDLSAEPVEDIVAGIRGLIARGLVDEARVGIAGHSHGAWLGPQVLTKYPSLFRAASFAEGSGDLISTYGQMAGWLNLNIHDYYWMGPPFGGSKYYLDNSPILHVAGLTTPTLFEFGDQSLAVQGLEYHSAFWRCGVPNELVIYPRTGHNMSRPAQEVESMIRNLDWFDYWMLGKRDGDPAKQEQYRRWEGMTGEMAAMRAKHACTAEPAARD